MHVASIHLSIHPSIHPSIYLSIYPSIDLSIYRSIYLSIYLSIFLSFFLSFFLSVYNDFSVRQANTLWSNPGWSTVDQRLINGFWWIAAWKSWTVRLVKGLRRLSHPRFRFLPFQTHRSSESSELVAVPRRLACLKNTSTAVAIWMVPVGVQDQRFFVGFFPIQTTYSRMILGSE